MTDKPIAADRQEVRWLLGGAVVLALLGLLYAAQLYSYNLFHSIAELFSVVVGIAVFIIAWNTRRFAQNSYLLVIGIAALFIAVVDCLHLLSYKGMGVFTPDDADLPTQLWLIGRYLQAASFVLAAVLLGRQVNPARITAGFGIATAVLLALVFVWHIFPAAFVEGRGLTPFKIVSEYVIAGGMVISLVLLHRKRSYFEPFVVRRLAAAIILFVVAELAFTLYSDVYGLVNVFGHVMRIVAIFLVYRAIVETSLTRPYSSLFRDLHLSESAYRQLYEQQHRVADELQGLLLSVPESTPGIAFGHIYRSAALEADVGGDFYDVFRVDDGRTAIVIGDVSGHGLEAAATAFLIREMTRAYAVDVKEPGGVMERANRGLIDRIEPGTFVTAFLAILDTTTGDIHFCSAGHPPALLRRRNGAIVQLGSSNLPLGVIADRQYTDGREVIEHDEMLLLYTDGLMEARRDGVLFGEERIRDLLRTASCAEVKDLPAQAVDSARDFAGGDLKDDVAVVALCRSLPGGASCPSPEC